MSLIYDNVGVSYCLEPQSEGGHNHVGGHGHHKFAWVPTMTQQGLVWLEFYWYHSIISGYRPERYYAKTLTKTRPTVMIDGIEYK